ncbi:hypothetical protein J6O48_08410 [bacterium]|nr:hypothetical protein [bacterium]
MKQISMAFEVKEGKVWKETYRTEDIATVYERLAHELLNHKVFHASYYRKMEQYNNYDGTRTVIFYQNTGRSKYIIAE